MPGLLHRPGASIHRTMPFRDQHPTCPSCRIALDRDPEGRERWRCPVCSGGLLGVGELVDELLAVAPELRPADGIRDVATVTRGRATLLRCAMCDADMEPGFLGGVEIDRCREHGVVWFDAGELARVLVRAAAQRAEREPGLVRRLLALLRW